MPGSCPWPTAGTGRQFQFEVSSSNACFRLPNDGGRPNPTLALFLTNDQPILELDLADFAMNSAWVAAEEQGEIVRERQLPQVANRSFGPVAVGQLRTKRTFADLGCGHLLLFAAVFFVAVNSSSFPYWGQ